MHKCLSEQLAKELAAKDGLHYGMSVFDGFFYTGTLLQLANIGVVTDRFSVSAMGKRDGKLHDDLAHFADRQAAKRYCDGMKGSCRSHELFIVVESVGGLGGINFDGACDEQ